MQNLNELQLVQRPSVEARLMWAEAITALTHNHPDALLTWDQVREQVHNNPLYTQPVKLTDDHLLGLVPLGEHPTTKLQEFYHLRSAWDGTSSPASIVIPRRSANGSIVVGEDTGIVFVLLPGGTVTLGTPGAESPEENEGSYTVFLHPFFLAAHEMTQGQLARLWTRDASLREPSLINKNEGFPAQHPVENVDWNESHQLLSHHMLVLPTESQWEYGCRGGSSTPWQVALTELRHFANVSDISTHEYEAGWQYEEWKDKHVFHAPVGSFRPNDYGLYDMHGNVFEWCLEPYSEAGTARQGDGRRIAETHSGQRSFRGGCFSGMGHRRPLGDPQSGPCRREGSPPGPARRQTPAPLELPGPSSASTAVSSPIEKKLKPGDVFWRCQGERS